MKIELTGKQILALITWLVFRRTNPCFDSPLTLRNARKEKGDLELGKNEKPRYRGHGMANVDCDKCPLQGICSVLREEILGCNRLCPLTVAIAENKKKEAA